jgi:hypothetical protein
MKLMMLPPAPMGGFEVLSIRWKGIEVTMGPFPGQAIKVRWLH